VLEHIATLQEIETHWSLNDLVKGNKALDLKETIERAQQKAQGG
jgi:hypothetical protein